MAEDAAICRRAGVPEALEAWLPQQRWFAGKGVSIDRVEVVAETLLVDGDPGMQHLVVTVDQDGATERYQLLVGLRASIPDTLAHAVIASAGWPAEDRMAYDALHDPELTRRLLQAIAAAEKVGPLTFAAEPEATIDATADGAVLSVEQSNTSLVFGEEAILKVFRRPTPGPNPDLEIPRALALAGSRHVAPPLGWLETSMDGQQTVLAVLSTYLGSAADGWSLASASAREMYADPSDIGTAAGSDARADFAAEARRLGQATAEVHGLLADVFGIEELPGDAHREIAAQMNRRLLAALAAVPELGQHSAMLSEAFAELAALDEPLVVQRVHGDYHLGQVMRTRSGWVLLDFEGEPATPLAQRRARSPALRDVAGMLRSFDYAARLQLPDGHTPGQAAAAREWVRHNQAAFRAGYTEADGIGAAGNAILLRALVLDKAVYEVLYEAKYRPSWLWVPLASLADL